jgi:hypothetical protein
MIDFPTSYQVTGAPKNLGSVLSPLSFDGSYTRHEERSCNGKPVYIGHKTILNYYNVLFQPKGTSSWAIGRTGSDSECDNSRGLYMQSSCGGACADTPDANGCIGNILGSATML